MPYVVQERLLEYYRDRFYLFDNQEIFEANQSESILMVFQMAARRYGCKLFLADNLMTALSDSDEETKAQFCKDVLSQNANIQFTWLDGDSVLLPGAHIFPAVQHMSTWKWAYLFEPIRAWLFEQKL